MTSLSLAAAMRDPNLLGGPFMAKSFWPWHCVAKVLSGEKLDDREAALFRQCTGRTKLLTGPARRLILLAGRRAGKDRFLSALAVYRAALAADWSRIMSAGEQAVVVLIGGDKKQAKILRRYCAGLLRNPLLAAEVVRDTGEAIEFRNESALEVTTNDAGLVRGRSAVAVIGTETSHWRTDDASASSDEEVVAAAEPAMAMTPDGGVMVLSSTVHRRRGYMARRFRELHGNDEAEDICWLAPSRTMNPALPESVVEKALADDPQRARAEYLSIWREDVTDFVPMDALEAVTDFGVRERPAEPGVVYQAFADAAGGTGRDSFTFAIGHRDKNGTAVLDILRERKPRFVPVAVVEEYAALAKAYRVSQICGDRYSSAWHADEWARRGFLYIESKETKSELYLACLPLILSDRCRLLDNPALRSQFSQLERRVRSNGRESVDDSGAASSHDDLANAAAGVLTRLAAGPGPLEISDELMAWARRPARRSVELFRY